MGAAAGSIADLREVELKLAFDAVDTAALLAALADLDADADADAQSASQLVSTYYDDADQTLRKSGGSLRVRQADGAFIQTVKTTKGGGLFDRGEWEQPLPSADLDLEAARNTPLKGALRKAGDLRPLFTSRVQRIAHTVIMTDGAIEAAVDIGQVETPAGQCVDLRQLELELKRGPPGLMFDLARSLSAGVPLRLTFNTKSGVGYALLAASVEAARSATPRLKKAMTAGDALQAMSRAALRNIVDNAQIMRDRRSAVAVHQLRVGLRRLRSALTLFKPILEDDRVASLSSELKWLASKLDEARDTDVFIAETYTPGAAALSGGGGGDLPALGALLETKRTRAYDRAIKSFNSKRSRAALILLAEWVEIGPWLTGRTKTSAKARLTPVADFAAEALTRRRMHVLRAGAHLRRLDPDRRHKLRIAVKKLRYGVDLFATLMPQSKVRAFRRPLKDLQETLGALNDIAVARRRATGHVEGAPAELGVAAGMVVGLRAGGEADLVAKASKRFKRLKAAKPPWS